MEPMPPATCSSSQNIRTRHSPAATRYGGGETREEAGNQCQGQDGPPPTLSKEGLQRQRGPAIAPRLNGDQIRARDNRSLPALTHAFMGSLALGLVSFGGRRGSSASLIRASSTVPASARRRACCCCSRVGGRPGSGGSRWIGVLSVRRTTASRSGRSGYSLAAHQRSAKRLPCRMLTTGAFLVCHIFRAFRCRRQPPSRVGVTLATSRPFHQRPQRSPICTHPDGMGEVREPW